jgi:hypothetical protein
MTSENQNYEFKIRVLGNEVLAVGISSTATSNKWIAISIASAFSALVLIGAYGEKFVNLFKMLTN